MSSYMKNRPRFYEGGHLLINRFPPPAAGEKLYYYIRSREASGGE